MSVLFTNVTAVTMDGASPLLKDAFVTVDGAVISYVGDTRPEGEFDRTIDCTGKVMMPGFVNCHTHIPMTLLRGYGGGHNLHTWLYDYIFPAEAKLTDRAVAVGAGLGLAEMIAAGVTCIADMYMRTEVIAQQVADAGISANLSVGGVYFGDPERFTPDDCADCRNQQELTERWHGHNDGQIIVDASIHGEYTSCAPLWRWMAAYAADHHLRMHMHISETKSEHNDCINRHHMTPIQIMDHFGVWDNGGIAAHCVHTEPGDWGIMSQKDITAVHNPWSNMKLGSGIAPIPDLLASGVNVALGSDGMSSHNCADMFSDMKLASVLFDPMAIPARRALEMATVNGAKALKRNTGVIAAGKTADLILVDFDRPHLTPCHDVEENLVYSAHAGDVVMNMARGKIIYENGEYYTLDLERIRSEVDTYALPLVRSN